MIKPELKSELLVEEIEDEVMTVKEYELEICYIGLNDNEI